MIKSLFGIYVGGMYYFSITNFPFMLKNRRVLKNPKPWRTFIMQMIAWPIVMPHIMIRGNPLLERIDVEKNEY